MQITLEGTSWHSNYYRWVFNHDLPKSLCPYFWQMVTIILFSPFIFSYKKLISYSDKQFSKNCNKTYTQEQLRKQLKMERILEIIGQIISIFIITCLCCTLLFVIIMTIVIYGFISSLIGLLSIIGTVALVVGSIVLFFENDTFEKITNSMIIQVPMQLISGMYHKMCPLITWNNLPANPSQCSEVHYDEWGDYIKK